VLLKGVTDFFLQGIYKSICRIRFRKAQIPKDDKFDLVCISHVSWKQSVWQRNHHVMSRLSEKHNVFYCNPIFVLYAVAKNIGLFSNIQGKYKKLTLYNPILLHGEKKLPFTKSLNKFLIVNSIKKLIYKKRLRDKVYNRNIVLWFYFPINEYIIGNLNENLIVYDIQDEYSAFAWISKNPSDIKERERKLIEKVDLLFTGTNSLFEKKRIFSNNAHFIPCGVEVEHFKKAYSESTTLPEDILNIKHPIIGYFGAIDERIDMELLRYISDIHPEWSIIMIGPIREHADIIPKSKNIYFFGQKDYHTLPNYLKAFDVCIIPFKMIELAVHTNPTKLLEYMAGGKLVVSTAITDLKKLYSDVIYIAENKEEFVKLTEKCIKEKNGDKVLKGIRISERNDWQSMVEKMESLILSNMRRKHNSI
jgi:glycosyltransferase involved in cell wall biosynthesis